jgi:O-antigen ligase
MVWIGVVIVAGFVLIFWYSDILNLIMRLMEALGLSSRTLNYLIGGNISYDSGRGEIYDNLIKAINQSPLLGLGAFGGEVAVGLSHSTYLDIFANFGYVFGSVFIVIIFCQIYKILSREKESSLGKIFLIFSTMVIVRGFFGGGFWSEKELWILFGIMINYKKYSVEMNKIQQKL